MFLAVVGLFLLTWQSPWRINPGDALVIVWGAERDTVTAAEEVRLRYVDAVDGVWGVVDVGGDGAGVGTVRDDGG